MAKEQRRHKRYYVKGLKHRLRQSYFFGLFSKPVSEAYPFPCVDISEGGLQFLTPRVLSPKESEGGLQLVPQKVFKPQKKIVLDIATHFTRSEPIRVKARVAWFRPSVDLQYGLAGVQFVSMTKSARAELRMILTRIGEDRDQIPQYVRVKMIKEVLS